MMPVPFMSKTLPNIVAGAVAGSAGLAVRLALPDQNLRLDWECLGEGTRVRLVAGTRFFPALFEQQIDRLVARLKESA